MPKKQILGNIFMIIILCFVCIYIYDNYHVVKETELVVESGNNNQTVVNYLTTKNSDYYLYNIDDIIVNYPDRTLELNRALDMKQISINTVLDYLEEKVNMSDGKIVLYQNDDFSLLQCTLDNGKTNYVFGNNSMIYKDSFCADPPYLCSFTKTYHVLDISPNKDNLVYLTLKNDYSEEVATIQIEKEKIENLTVGNYYTFKFASVNDVIESDIKSTFDNNRILEIHIVNDFNPTVNDNICK